MHIDIETNVLITNLPNSYRCPCSPSERATLFNQESTLIVHDRTEYKDKSTIERFFLDVNKTNKAGHLYRHHLCSIEINVGDLDTASAMSYLS